MKHDHLSDLMFDNFHILNAAGSTRRRLRRRIVVGSTICGSIVAIVFFHIGTPSTFGTMSTFFGGDTVAEPLVAPIAPPPPPPVLLASSTPPVTTAESIVVRDRASGVVVYENNSDSRRPIASITKLMSALVLLDTVPVWGATTTVVSDVVDDAHLLPGDLLSIGDLWHAALIGSSNRAILTLVDASGLSRDEFATRMNVKANILGLDGTVFTEPTGLDEGNLSTARDVLLLLDISLRQPEIQTALLATEYQWYSTGEESWRHMWNTNWLLLGWIPHEYRILGGKTGFTPAAGYSVVLSLVDDYGHVIDIAILGAESHEARFTEARDLAAWVFENFLWE